LGGAWKFWNWKSLYIFHIFNWGGLEILKLKKLIYFHILWRVFTNIKHINVWEKNLELNRGGGPKPPGPLATPLHRGKLLLIFQMSCSSLIWTVLLFFNSIRIPLLMLYNWCLYIWFSDWWLLLLYLHCLWWWFLSCYLKINDDDDMYLLYHCVSPRSIAANMNGLWHFTTLYISLHCTPTLYTSLHCTLHYTVHFTTLYSVHFAIVPSWYAWDVIGKRS